MVKREYSTASSFLFAAQQAWLTVHGILCDWKSVRGAGDAIYAGRESKRGDCTLCPTTKCRQDAMSNVQPNAMPKKPPESAEATLNLSGCE
ncbi:hypothetical protein HMPREF1587_00378 [Bifidobacterium breve JCP7499]|nr:hypothetical protein HMPREF1587_00378 [Bifidobacterium breve JCP7499]